MKIFFTADQHLGHARIIDYCSRPFKDVHEMDETIIYNYNSIVAPEDTVFFLGDFTGSRDDKHVRKLTERLNGTKHLILGNHDYFRPFAYVGFGFSSVHTALVLNEYKIGLTHDPAIAVVNKDLLWLCGHVHGLFKQVNYKQSARVINVGVDVWDFKPVDLTTIQEKCVWE